MYPLHRLGFIGVLFFLANPLYALDHWQKLLIYPPVKLEHSQVLEKTAKYRVIQFEVTQPDAYQNATQSFRFKLFQAKRDTPRPLVLILAPYRGETVVDQGFAETLAERGLHVLTNAVPSDAFDTDADLDYPNRFFVRHVTCLRAMLDFLQQNPPQSMQISQIGVLGISLGGIRAALLTGVDDRIRAAVIIASGADLPTLLAQSVLTPIADWRRKQLHPDWADFEHLTEDDEPDGTEFAALLQDKIQIDPLKQPPRLAPQNCYFLRTRGDSFIPTDNQQALFEHYSSGASQPFGTQMGLLSVGHYTGILASYYEYRHEIVTFLVERLDN